MLLSSVGDSVSTDARPRAVPANDTRAPTGPRLTRSGPRGHPPVGFGPGPSGLSGGRGGARSRGRRSGGDGRGPRRHRRRVSPPGRRVAAGRSALTRGARRRSRRASRAGRRRRPRCGRERPARPRSPAPPRQRHPGLPRRDRGGDGSGCPRWRFPAGGRRRSACRRRAGAAADRAAHRSAPCRCGCRGRSHQHLAPALDLQVVPGDRVVLQGQVGLRRASDHRPLARQRHRPWRLAACRDPDPRVHRRL